MVINPCQGGWENDTELQAFINKAQPCSGSGEGLFVSMGSSLPEAAGARQLQGLGVNSLLKWFLISVKQTPQLLGVNWCFYMPSSEPSSGEGLSEGEMPAGSRGQGETRQFGCWGKWELGRAGQGRWASLNPLEAQGLFAHITSQDITPFLVSTCHGKNWYLSILLLTDGGDQLI